MASAVDHLATNFSFFCFAILLFALLFDLVVTQLGAEATTSSYILLLWVYSPRRTSSCGTNNARQPTEVVVLA
jgi:hypothetical protein